MGQSSCSTEANEAELCNDAVQDDHVDPKECEASRDGCQQNCLHNESYANNDDVAKITMSDDQVFTDAQVLENNTVSTQHKAHCQPQIRFQNIAELAPDGIAMVPPLISLIDGARSQAAQEKQPELQAHEDAPVLPEEYHDTGAGILSWLFCDEGDGSDADTDDECSAPTPFVTSTLGCDRCGCCRRNNGLGVVGARVAPLKTEDSVRAV